MAGQTTPPHERIPVSRRRISRVRGASSPHEPSRAFGPLRAGSPRTREQPFPQRTFTAKSGITATAGGMAAGGRPEGATHRTATGVVTRSGGARTAATFTAGARRTAIGVSSVPVTRRTGGAGPTVPMAKAQPGRRTHRPRAGGRSAPKQRTPGCTHPTARVRGRRGAAGQRGSPPPGPPPTRGRARCTLRGDAGPSRPRLLHVRRVRGRGGTLRHRGSGTPEALSGPAGARRGDTTIHGAVAGGRRPGGRIGGPAGEVPVS